MSSFEEHCRECEEKLGERFEDVHTFLDQFFGKFGFDHRRVFHHDYGIQLVCHFWGEKAAEAAKLHIRADCDGEVPKVSDWVGGNCWLNG